MFCAAPFIGIVAILILWWIMSAITSAVVASQGVPVIPMWIRKVNAWLQIIGGLFVIMIPVSAIMGIINLSRGPSGPPPSEPPTRPPQSPQL